MKILKQFLCKNIHTRRIFYVSLLCSHIAHQICEHKVQLTLYLVNELFDFIKMTQNIENNKHLINSFFYTFDISALMSSCWFVKIAYTPCCKTRHEITKCIPRSQAPDVIIISQNKNKYPIPINTQRIIWYRVFIFIMEKFISPGACDFDETKIAFAWDSYAHLLQKKNP